MRVTFVPDLDDYQQVRSEDGGCKGCVFQKMPNVKCSAIPCHPQMHRPYAVIYTKETPVRS